MKTRIFNIVLAITLAGTMINSQAQTSTYNDVIVVINIASGISDSIGTYFASARNLPEENIIRVTAPITEEIDSLQFENLRKQIESALISRDLKDSINYIVTTKGVPLKVKRYTANANSSVENELTLILGTNASYIGKNGRIGSPYYNQRVNFTRKQFGIYLVTRLDGYSFSDIKALIDRSSNISSSIPSEATFVLDQDPLWSASTPYLNTFLSNAANQLRTRGQSVNLDTTAVYLTHQTNVMGYVSWGSNDYNDQLYTTNAKPMNTYLPGAIAETYVSTSARSFTYPTSYGQSLAADLIAEGVTAVKGYVYEPYSNAMSDASILMPMYVDGYTIAESFYAASYFLGWMDVVIGDPKFRITTTRMPADTSNFSPNEDPQAAMPVELTSFTATSEQNTVTLNWNTATEINCYGFEVERRTVNGQEWSKVGFVNGNGNSSISHNYSFSDKNLSTGSYVYRIKQIDNDGSYAYYGNNEVNITNTQKQLVLNDNYPNPFNPSTKISFTTANTGKTTLRIYNIIGQQVAVLFDQITTGGENHQVTFNASSLASGVYFARLETADQTLVKRMLLTK